MGAGQRGIEGAARTAGGGGAKSSGASLASHWAALAVPVLIFATASLAFVWRHTPIDDAFISYRYAKNLATGHGAVFNPGERVEGYSSVSWVLLLALGDELGAEPPLLSKGIGLLLGAGTLLLFAAAPVDWRTRLSAGALLSVHAPFLYHSINGLETSLMTFLVTALVLLSFGSRASRIGAPAVAALLVLTRPEGLPCVLAWQACATLVHGLQLGRRLLPASLTASAVFLTHTLIRWLYYGDWIANSARAKVLPLSIALPAGLWDWFEYLRDGGGWGVFFVLGACGAILGRAHRPSVSVAAFVLVFALVLAVSGGDSFPLWRFYVPLAPLFMLCAARGLAVICFGATGVGRGVRRSIGFGLSIAGIALALVLPLRNQRADLERERQWARHWEGIGRRLADLLPSDTTIALCPVGALSYYSGFRVVDMLGLTDAKIARLEPDTRYYYPGHQKHDAAYVLSREPDLLMLANGPPTSGFGNRFPWNLVRIYERDVLEDERFRRDYRLIHVAIDAKTSVGLFAQRGFAVHGIGGIREGMSP